MGSGEALIGLGLTLMLGAMSPGPSFLMVARTAVAVSRPAGLAAALGMGMGGLCYAVLALLGLQAVLAAAPHWFVAFQIAGGLYLAVVGIRIFRSARQPLLTGEAESAPRAGGSLHRYFLLGLGTQISNPKTAVVYASVLAAFMPASPTPAFQAAMLVLVFAIEAGWFATVALGLSSERPRRAYVRNKPAIDRVAGTAMIGIGLRLATGARAL